MSIIHLWFFHNCVSELVRSFSALSLPLGTVTSVHFYFLNSVTLSDINFHLKHCWQQSGTGFSAPAVCVSPRNLLPVGEWRLVRLHEGESAGFFCHVSGLNQGSYLINLIGVPAQRVDGSGEDVAYKRVSNLCIDNSTANSPSALSGFRDN